MEGSKRHKYLEHYQQLRYALAPILMIEANSSGRCGPDCLKILWLTADHPAESHYGFSLDDVNNNYLNEHIIDSQQAIDYQRVRGKTLS